MSYTKTDLNTALAQAIKLQDLSELKYENAAYMAQDSFNRCMIEKLKEFRLYELQEEIIIKLKEALDVINSCEPHVNTIKEQEADLIARYLGHDICETDMFQVMCEHSTLVSYKEGEIYSAYKNDGFYYVVTNGKVYKMASLADKRGRKTLKMV